MALHELAEVAGVTDHTVTRNAWDLIEGLGLPIYKHERTGRLLLPEADADA